MFGLACSGAKTDKRLGFPCKPVCKAGGGFGVGKALKGGVTNPGLLRIRGREVRLLGEGAAAIVQRNDRSIIVRSDEERDLTDILRV